VLPSWTAERTQQLSREVEAALADGRHRELLAVLYGNEPRRWSESLTGWDRLRCIVNACTRLRFCLADDTMELREKRGPAHAPEGFVPWFEIAERRTAGTMVICGHWSTLGLTVRPGVAMLDSGCVWGGALTAMRLDDGEVFQVPSRQPRFQAPFG
jgi:bis(5'-nucleosyl)-tetraphosphatase (symmetrical)